MEDRFLRYVAHAHVQIQGGTIRQLYQDDPSIAKLCVWTYGSKWMGGYARGVDMRMLPIIL